MTYTIKLADGADKVLAKWKKSNPNLFKKYRKIYDELLDHPKTGLGHPEQLRGGGGITWSRRITAHDRMIYDIYEDIVSVYILELEGHYDDK
jgi:toxin YoeB